MYIGCALGRKGLYDRIVSQHFNCKYLESRKNKINERDLYQITDCLNKNNKICIDKSVLRKNIGRLHKLGAGIETTQFILDNFYLSYITMDELNIDKKEIKQLEKELIELYSPIYNIQYNKNTLI